MGYQEYILPGNAKWILLYLENTELLIQKVDGGVMLHEFFEDALVREKIVDEVTEERASGMEYLSETEGVDFSHCLHIAYRHSSYDFLDRLCGYRCLRSTHFFTKIRFDFYAEKPS